MHYPLNFELAIRNHLAAYLAGEISFSAFEDWFFPKTWNVEQMRLPTLTDLVYKIKLAWAEFSHGDWTEDEFRSILRSLIEHFRIGEESPISISYGTSNQSVQSSLYL